MTDITNSFDEEKALCMEKLEESENVIKELREYIEELKTPGETEIMNKMRSDLEKANRECSEMQDENKNLLSQLMNLRHLNEEKDALVHRLESKLAMWQEQVPSTENGLEAQRATMHS